MKMAMKGWLGIGIVAGALAVGGCEKTDNGSQARASGAAGDVQPGSAAAQDSGRPALRQRMSPIKFEERFKKALEKLPALTDREKAKGAAWGYRVTSVDAGSQAERAGIKVGDAIVGIDGQRAWGEGRLASLRKDGPQVLTIVGEDLKAREVKVAAGRIGVKGERQWDPELVYLRGPHRDKRWDDLARVALRWMWDEPDLAETAMNEAIAKGYPADGVSDLVGYATAMPNELSPARAMEFARRRETSGEYGADMPVWPAGMYYAGIAEGDLKTAQEALQDGLPDALTDTSRQVEDLVKAAGGATTRPAEGRSPTELAQQMKSTPLIPLCKGLNSWADSYLDHMRKVGMPIRIMAPAGSFAPFVIRSIRPAQDVVAEVTFKTRPTDNAQSGFSRLMAVGLMDLADQRPGPGLDQDGRPGGILGFEYCADNGWMSVYHGYGEQIVQRPSSFKLEETVTLRLVHVGGWDEVFVNDERIAYLPRMAPCKKMAFYIKSVGMDVCVEALRYDALGEEPDTP